MRVVTSSVLAMVAVVVLGGLAACTSDGGRAGSAGAVTPGSATRTPSPTATTTAVSGRTCPRRAHGDARLIERLVVPDDGLNAGVLCRYSRRPDGSLVRSGSAQPLTWRQAAQLWQAFTARSLGMVDCQPTPEQGVYAVLDRGREGQARVVTVDLGLCGTIRAVVRGGVLEEPEQLWGLATREHRRLIRAAWSSR